MPETNSLKRVSRKIWRLFPRTIRQFVFNEALPLLAPNVSGAATAQQPISLLAPLSSSIGIGWGGRENFKLLNSCGYDVGLYDWTDVLFEKDLRNEPLGQTETPPVPGPGILLCHANPNHLPILLFQLGRQAVVGKYVISYAVWELPQLPAHWIRNLRFAHTFWCPSSFAADAFRKATDKPVHIVPHCIDVPKDTRPDRDRFRIPRNRFTVLTAIHLGSGLSRKNPLAAIRAFRSAFSNDQKATLLVKVSHAEHYPSRFREIERAIQGAPNVRLIQEVLTDNDVWNLLHSVDAVLSLHRSEGFGLVPAQAMALGKLAIATGWSGNMDYMNSENSLPVDFSLVPVDDPECNYRGDGQKWASPDIDHAAVLLREAAENAVLRQRIGETASCSMRKRFGPDAVARSMKVSLADLGVAPVANVGARQPNAKDQQ